MSALPLFGGELDRDDQAAPERAPARQECFAGILDTPQERMESQEDREAYVNHANKAARKALAAARAGTISVEEYAAIERVAGRAQWEAAIGAFELKGEDG